MIDKEKLIKELTDVLGEQTIRHFREFGLSWDQYLKTASIKCFIYNLNGYDEIKKATKYLFEKGCFSFKK
ncbi:MAG: hypothetical protein ACOCP4_00680 [Candidatus Woesearchaeota archaeon]